jgi:hypothetical protein
LKLNLGPENKTLKKISSKYKQYIPLVLVFLIGLAARLFFKTGHIFSDDAYYSYLAHTLPDGNFANDYLGYPVFPLRTAFIGLTSLSMMIFGENESATIFFLFFFSMLNILLTYKTALLLTGSEKVSLISAFLISFFPTDVVFASMAFPDLINLFFINLGIYYLFKSYLKNRIQYSLAGGIFLFLSMQFKENIYYVLILLIILLLYFLVKTKQIIPQLLIGLLFIAGNFLIEGFVYLLLHNDFLNRITITNINYIYSYYDFFPYTAQKLSGSENYLRNLFDQVFLINAKSIFLRRFYLFLPIVSLIQTYLSIKKKEHPLLLFWFWGTAILMIAFTTSFTGYKPLDLARSWYIYPVLMPMILLSSLFVNRFSNLVGTGMITIYILGSLIMCFEYKIFFDQENLNSLKSYLRENPSKTIYTDHFTKYSIDLIQEYKTNNSERIAGSNFNFDVINKGEWILFNKKHIEELQMQQFDFPDFGILNSNKFKKTASFKDFIFYEKVR